MTKYTAKEIKRKSNHLKIINIIDVLLRSIPYKNSAYIYLHYTILILSFMRHITYLDWVIVECCPLLIRRTMPLPD